MLKLWIKDKNKCVTKSWNKWFKNCWSLKMVFQRDFLKELSAANFRTDKGNLF